MKLNRLSLENFRPFFGEQVLEFAEGKARNVTLVHAQNGMGKTTLLNALLWAFHEEVTKGFRDPTLIVNKEAKAKGANQARVTVLFEHEGVRYELIRSASDGQKNSNVRVFIVAADGTRSPHPHEKTFIQQVFPKEMAPYFFFDGEYAQNFASSTGSAEVREAIRKILGCAPAEQAIADLLEAEKKLHRQVRQASSSSDVGALEDQRSSATDLITQIESSLPLIHKERTQLQAELEDIQQRLVAIQASAELARERKLHEGELQRTRIEIEQARTQQLRWIGDQATILASGKIIAACEEISKGLKKRAEIPAPYNETFVKALLEKMTCVCGRPLEPGSPECSSVSALLSTAAESESLRRLVGVQAFCRGHEKRRQGAITALHSIERNLVAGLERAARLESQIAELSKKLKNIDLSDVAEREAARRSKMQRLQELGMEEQRSKAERLAALSRIENIDLDLKKKMREDKTLKAQARKLAFLKKAKGQLEVLLKTLEIDAVYELSKNSNELLLKILRKAYQVTITDDFALRLTDEHRRPVPASGGEGQLLSLVFIASLIQFCAKRASNADVILSPGTVAPLVLDSPFGQLDTVYREEAAKFLSKFSDQIVLLLSASQGDPGVVAALRSSVGSECVLIQHNEVDKPEVKGDRVDEIVVDGNPIVVTFWASAPTRTEIDNVSYREDES